MEGKEMEGRMEGWEGGREGGKEGRKEGKGSIETELHKMLILSNFQLS